MRSPSTPARQLAAEPVPEFTPESREAQKRPTSRPDRRHVVRPARRARFGGGRRRLRRVGSQQSLSQNSLQNRGRRKNAPHLAQSVPTSWRPDGVPVSEAVAVDSGASARSRACPRIVSRSSNSSFWALLLIIQGFYEDLLKLRGFPRDRRRQLRSGCGTLHCPTAEPLGLMERGPMPRYSASALRLATAATLGRACRTTAQTTDAAPRQACSCLSRRMR